MFLFVFGGAPIGIQECTWKVGQTIEERDEIAHMKMRQTCLGLQVPPQKVSKPSEPTPVPPSEDLRLP